MMYITKLSTIDYFIKIPNAPLGLGKSLKIKIQDNYLYSINEFGLWRYNIVSQDLSIIFDGNGLANTLSAFTILDNHEVFFSSGGDIYRSALSNGTYSTNLFLNSNFDVVLFIARRKEISTKHLYLAGVNNLNSPSQTSQCNRLSHLRHCLLRW